MPDITMPAGEPALPETATSVAVTGVQELTTLTEPLPTPGPGEALVRVAYTGICGSDIPRYFDGGVHAFPQVLGHEFSGVVAALGPAADESAPRAPGNSAPQVGARVAVAPLVPCHECERCLAGAPAQCGHYSFIGSRRQGAMSDYVVVPQVNLVPVPHALSLKAAALVEPLSVAIHGVDKAPDPAGQSVVILGGGVIGLMTLLYVLDRGAADVTVVDVAPFNLEMATRLGAHRVVDPRDGGMAALASTAHLVVETAGAAATRAQSLEVAAKDGHVVYVGTPSADLVLDPHAFELILRGELTLHGSWMSYSAPFPGAEWTTAARILAEADFDPAVLVSHEFPLDRVADGFAAIREGERRLKIMFRVAGEEAGA